MSNTDDFTNQGNEEEAIRELTTSLEDALSISGMYFQIVVHFIFYLKLILFH